MKKRILISGLLISTAIASGQLVASAHGEMHEVNLNGPATSAVHLPAGFNPTSYLALNEDLRIYASAHPDDITAVGDINQWARNHYINSGKNEGRQFYSLPAGFNPTTYLALNADLQQHISTNPADVLNAGSAEKWAINHYLSHGKNEGRIFQNITPARAPHAPEQNSSSNAPLNSVQQKIAADKAMQRGLAAAALNRVRVGNARSPIATPSPLLSSPSVSVIATPPSHSAPARAPLSSIAVNMPQQPAAVLSAPTNVSQTTAAPLSSIAVNMPQQPLAVDSVPASASQAAAAPLSSIVVNMPVSRPQHSAAGAMGIMYTYGVGGNGIEHLKSGFDKTENGIVGRTTWFDPYLGISKSEVTMALPPYYLKENDLRLILDLNAATTKARSSQSLNLFVNDRFISAFQISGANAMSFEVSPQIAQLNRVNMQLKIVLNNPISSDTEVSRLDLNKITLLSGGGSYESAFVRKNPCQQALGGLSSLAWYLGSKGYDGLTKLTSRRAAQTANSSNSLV